MSSNVLNFFFTKNAPEPKGLKGWVDDGTSDYRRKLITMKKGEVVTLL